MRQARKDHVAAQPQSIRALLFHRPPAAVLDMIPDDAVIGLYAATGSEAPTMGYARFFHERGHVLALPRLENAEGPMSFARFDDPFLHETLLETGPGAIRQPSPDAPEIVPDIVFVPLLAFTPGGDRLGQGGGHYDRWLASHPETLAIGLAWDVQQADLLPTEAHDHKLAGVITPTRMHGLSR